jgi:hypothetical protein
MAVFIQVLQHSDTDEWQHSMIFRLSVNARGIIRVPVVVVYSSNSDVQVPAELGMSRFGHPIVETGEDTNNTVSTGYK